MLAYIIKPSMFPKLFYKAIKIHLTVKYMNTQFLTTVNSLKVGNAAGMQSIVFYTDDAIIQIETILTLTASNTSSIAPG